MFIHFGPIVFWLWLLPLLTLVSFTLAGPVAIASSVYFVMRRRTRRLGLLMLVSGIAGYVCVAAAVALRIRVYPRYPLYGASPPGWLDTITTSLIDGLSGFTAFAIFAVMFHFRSPMGLTKRSSEPPTGVKIST
jgi:hypothetical protein